MLGAEHETIAPGEAVVFSIWTPHCFGVVDEPVEIVLIVGAEGALEHLHR